jgi:hypothetical protein
MNKSYWRMLTGWLLIATPIVMMTAFTLLQMNFEYPDILRKPTGEVLQKFTEGGSGLLATWYVFMFSAVMFTLVAVLVRPYLEEERGGLMDVAVVVGVLAGLVQFLGLIRWVFIVPYLAQTYLDPAATASTREAVEVVFQAFHRYAGMAIGEHLGYLFTGTWTILVGVAMLRAPMFKAWLGWIGIVMGVGIMLGVLEPAGVEWAGLVNALAYMGWAVWVLLAGVFVLRGKTAPARVMVGAKATA